MTVTDRKLFIRRLTDELALMSQAGEDDDAAEHSGILRHDLAACFRQ